MAPIQCDIQSYLKISCPAIISTHLTRFLVKFNDYYLLYLFRIDLSCFLHAAMTEMEPLFGTSPHSAADRVEQLVSGRIDAKTRAGYQAKNARIAKAVVETVKNGNRLVVKDKDGVPVSVDYKKLSIKRNAKSVLQCIFANRPLPNYQQRPRSAWDYRQRGVHCGRCGADARRIQGLPLE